MLFLIIAVIPALRHTIYPDLVNICSDGEMAGGNFSYKAMKNCRLSLIPYPRSPDGQPHCVFPAA